MANIYKERKDKSKAQEKRVAKKIRGRRNPLSGALEWKKGDISNDFILGECKGTGKKSITIFHNVISKIVEEAYSMNKKPMISIELNNLDMSPHTEGVDRDWIMVESRFFSELIDAYNYAIKRGFNE